MKSGYIVGIGELLWDILPDGKMIGGAPGNFAYHASQFGYQGSVVSSVGYDKLGDEILNDIDSKGLAEYVGRVEYPTGIVAVTLDENGVPRYNIKEGVAWDNTIYTKRLEELAHKTLAVAFGTLAQRNATTRETIERFVDAVPNDDDRYKVFDINLRQEFFSRETICRSMERCNILKLNDEELTAISRMLDIDEADIQDRCRALLAKHNLKMVILTCGENGSYVFTSGEVSFVATPKVKVADTVGAGDSFIATFVASMISGESLRDAHLKAVRVSAYVCTQRGAMPVIPDSLK